MVKKPTVCKICGGTEQVSWHRLCIKCQTQRLRRNIQSLQTHEGPDYEKWAAGLLHAIKTKRKGGEK